MKRSILPCPCACKAQKTTIKTATRKAAHKASHKGATPEKKQGYTVEIDYERKHHPTELRKLSFRMVDSNGLACTEWLSFPWCSVDMVDAISLGLRKGFQPILNGWINNALPRCIQVVPSYLATC